MNKKISKDIFSDSSKQMNRNYLLGNFYYARKDAHQILASTPADFEREAALLILKKTWPDSQALLAGLACLAFSISVAFLWS